ncbi:hypothetical protein EJB05_50938, partial [Eragrostis curvula]
MFKKVKTAWVSHLPKASYVWNWTGSSSSSDWYNGGTFEDLTLLHLSYCPRIVQVIHFPLGNHAFDRLETLEITWCGDVSVAFHAYNTTGPKWKFPKLKHIRLHELPKLQKICNFSLIVTSELETIKIRGCWSLRTLPVVRTGRPWSNILPIVESANAVKCDCEKKWWDRLKWQSKEHASHYKPIHLHYKTTVLSGSVLSHRVDGGIIYESILEMSYKDMGAVAGPKEMSYTKDEISYPEAKPSHCLLTLEPYSKSHAHQLENRK